MTDDHGLELRLLGLMLESPEAADLAMTRVRGSEFRNSTLGALFDRLVAARGRGEIVTADTLPAFYARWDLTLPERVPDPMTWSLGDGAALAIDLGETIRTEFLHREGLAVLTEARKQVLDRSTHPITTLSSVRRELDELIDESALSDDDPAVLRTVLEGDSSYDWLIPDLLERKDRLVVTGPEGGGKTMLLRQLAICASAGLHPFTRTTMEPRGVLYIDVENTTRQWQRTAGQTAVLAAQRGRRDPRDHLRLLCRGRLDLTNPLDEAMVHRLVDRTKPDLVFIGPLYKLVPRAITNDDDAAPLITALDGLRDRGLTLVMEAHAGHATMAGGERDMRPRGSSALLGWPEFGLGLRPIEEDRTVSSLVRWRGDRDQRAWPRHLHRNGDFPWTAA